MGTSNLSILSAYTDPITGEMTCVVNPTYQLYIKKLIIEPYPNLPIPIGIVTPGTPQRPATRTIFVDSHDPVFSTPAPFTLTLTFDEGYRLTQPLQLVQPGAIQMATAAFNFAPVDQLSPEDAAIFVTAAVARAIPRINLHGPEQLTAGSGHGVSTIETAPKSKHDKGPHRPSKNGHDKHHPRT